MILKVNNTAYLIKKTFSLNRVIDMELLKEIKSYWGATNVIVQKSKRLVYLVELIEDVEILEEWVDGKKIHQLESDTPNELTDND